MLSEEAFGFLMTRESSVVNPAGMYNALIALRAFVDLIGDAIKCNPVQEAFIIQKYIP